MDQELIVKSVVDSTTEVFHVMLGMKARFEGLLTEAQRSYPGLISLVGITGQWGGSGVFCCTPAFAKDISASMLGALMENNSGAVDDEVMDVVAELTNMIVGNLKNHLEPITGPLAISVPTVIHGRNFQFRNCAGVKGTSLGFRAGAGAFEVRIALAPSPGTTTIRSKIPMFGLAVL